MKSLCITPFLLSCGLAAQTLVVPSTFATREGGGNSEAPGDWRPVHMQCIYNRDFIPGAVRVMRGVRFRPDGNRAATANTRQVKVEVATVGVPKPEFSSAIYEGNRGSDLKTVFSGTLNLPAVTAMPGPRPFSLSIPFNAQFLRGPNTNLLVEITVTGSTFSSQGWRPDATAGRVVSPGGTKTKIGQGCPTSFDLNPRGLTPYPGALFQLVGAPGSTSQLPYLLVIGSNNTNLDLTSLGLPGCRLYQLPLVLLPGVTQANGTILASFGKIAEDSSLTGLTLLLQAFVADSSFNAGGFRASSGLNMSLGQGFPVGLDAHAWYDRRNNTQSTFAVPDFRSTRTPILQIF